MRNLVTLGLMHTSDATPTNKINTTKTREIKFFASTTTTTARATKCCCLWKLLLLLLLLLLPYFALKVTWQKPCNSSRTITSNSSSSNIGVTSKKAARSGDGTIAAVSSDGSITAPEPAPASTLDNSVVKCNNIYRVQYFDNKTNDNNFDSNIAKIVAANATLVVELAVAHKVNCDSHNNNNNNNNNNNSNNITFFSFCILAVFSLFELLATFLYYKKERQQQQKQQHMNCQAIFTAANESADTVVVVLSAVATNNRIITTAIKLAAAAATAAHLYAVLITTEGAAALATAFLLLLSSKIFALYTILLTMKKAITATKPAITTIDTTIFIIFWLLQRFCTQVQQQQRKQQEQQQLQQQQAQQQQPQQYNISNIQQQQQIMYTNCSKHCGNMYQKQQQQQQQRQLKLRNSVQQQQHYNVTMQHDVLLIHKQATSILVLQFFNIFATKPVLAFYCLQKQKIRHRRRRKRNKLLQQINNNSKSCCCTSCCNSKQQRKHIKKAACESSENNGSSKNSKNDNNGNSNRYNNSNKNSNRSSPMSNNSSNDSSRHSTSSSSSSGSGSNANNNSHCYSCCCCFCCCYCCTYHCSDCLYCFYCCCCYCCCCWYCCCCCCCCCCSSSRLGKSSFRHYFHCCHCCCLCRRQQFKTNEYNNPNSNNNKTNSNSKNNDFKVQDNSNCNNGSSRSSGTSKQYSWQQQQQSHHYYYYYQQQQQQQQHNHKEYYQQQHKRQQQQHLFYQQHNCYHRRRRRHFCASYTSLHSCCCCFFKWICWRHQNHHNCHTATAIAAAARARQHSNIVSISKQQHQQSSVTSKLPTVATYQQYLICNKKWHRCCCCCSVRETLKQQQIFQKSSTATSTAATTTTVAAAVPPKRSKTTVATTTKKKGVLLNLNAFQTITATAISTLTTTTKRKPPSPTATAILPDRTTTTTLISSPLSSTTGRMCRRLPFRCNWLWLIIGLVWLEGPTLATCNNSWQINSSINSSSSNDNDGNNRSATAGAVNYKTTAAAAATTTTTPTKTTTPFYDCNSCKQHSAAIFHTTNVNEMQQTRQKQRFLRRSLSTTAATTATTATTATAKMFAIKFGQGFLIADPANTQWSDASMRARENENRQQSDDVRLESIKRQILSRLGLKRKPNVTHPLPKQFIWDTIYRADGISSVIDFDFNDDHRRQRIISSRDGQKLGKFAAMSPGHSFNDATSHKAIVMANSRVTRAYSPFLSHANDGNENGGVLESSTNGYSDNDNVGDIGNGGDKIYDENEHKTLVYERRQQQKYQQKQQQHQLRNPKEKSRSYHSYGHNDGYGYGTVHIDQRKKVKSSNFDNEANSEQQRIHEHDDWEKDPYEPEEFYGITQEIILFAIKGKMYKKHRLVEFAPPTRDIPSRQLQIRHADIHVRIERTSFPMSMQQRRRRNTKLKLWIFQLVDNGDFMKRGFDQVARLCASLHIEHHTLGWQKLDLTETVQHWYDQLPEKKLRLLIDCTGCGQHFVLHLFDVHNKTAQEGLQQRRKTHHHGARRKLKSENDTEIIAADDVKPNFEQQTFRKHTSAWSSKISKNKNINNKQQQHKQLLKHYNYKQQATAPMPQTAAAEFYHLDDQSSVNPNRPFLVLHTEPKRARRVRRRVIDCAGAQHGQCCKESFYVSFKALGWDDWIIAPRGYFANYCRGDCSGPYRTPDTFQTFHAHFIEEYRKMGLLNGMQPCCAPIKFSSMSLIYYGDDGIIKRDLPKMVVDECGCP